MRATWPSVSDRASPPAKNSRLMVAMASAPGSVVPPAMILAL